MFRFLLFVQQILRTFIFLQVQRQWQGKQLLYRSYRILWFYKSHWTVYSKFNSKITWHNAKSASESKYLYIHFLLYTLQSSTCVMLTFTFVPHFKDDKTLNFQATE